MKKVVFLLLILIQSLSVVSLAYAGFDEAKAAYDRGDYATALKELKPLAEQGNTDAQWRLGLMYMNGQGVPKDDVEANKWIRKVAEQGYALAQAMLGAAYLHGLGVPQDYAEAPKWTRKAADQGQAGAQCNLGTMYYEGQGVPQDYVQAHMWSNLAAAQGNLQSKENREIIAKRMTPAQIAEAQRLAREWKPKGGE